jgi:hypothetical protein
MVLRAPCISSHTFLEDLRGFFETPEPTQTDTVIAENLMRDVYGIHTDVNEPFYNIVAYACTHTCVHTYIRTSSLSVSALLLLLLPPLLLLLLLLVPALLLL